MDDEVTFIDVHGNGLERLKMALLYQLVFTWFTVA